MKVKPPAETPEEKAARAARLKEERRADAAFTETTQDLLDDETRKRVRRLGARARMAGAAGAAGFSAGVANVAAGYGGSGSYAPPAGGGYGGGGGGKFNDVLV